MRRPWFAWQGVVLPEKGTCGHIKDLVSTEDCAKYETVGDFRARKSGLPRTEMGTSAHEIGGLPRTYLKIYTRHQDIYRIRVCGNLGNVEEPLKELRCGFAGSKTNLDKELRKGCARP
jgi:hypothetical protein